MASEALDSTVWLSYQRIAHYRFPYGHTHKKQEEVYMVWAGAGG